MKTLQYTLLVAYMAVNLLKKAIIITQLLVHPVTTAKKLIIKPIAE